MASIAPKAHSEPRYPSSAAQTAINIMIRPGPRPVPKPPAVVQAIYNTAANAAETVTSEVIINARPKIACAINGSDWLPSIRLCKFCKIRALAPPARPDISPVSLPEEKALSPPPVDKSFF